MTARWLLAWFLAALVFMALAGVALAHEWYPSSCCSGGDCAPLAGSRVRVTAAGYLVDGIHAVAFKDARKSMDGRYHGCFPTPAELRCFFAPRLGS